MDVKEKLVTILGDFLLWPSKMKYVWMPQGIENLADHLIAHSVTLVPHGRWEQVEDFDGEHHWRCSACGIEWWFEVGGPVENGAHYCPNCGAKVDG